MKLLLLFCLKGIFLSSENTPIVRVLHRSFEEPSALADERCLQAGFSSFHLTVLKRRRKDEIKLKLKKLHFSSTRSCSVTFFSEMLKRAYLHVKFPTLGRDHAGSSRHSHVPSSVGTSQVLLHSSNCNYLS